MRRRSQAAVRRFVIFVRRVAIECITRTRTILAYMGLSPAVLMILRRSSHRLIVGHRGLNLGLCSRRTHLHLRLSLISTLFSSSRGISRSANALPSGRRCVVLSKRRLSARYGPVSPASPNSRSVELTGGWCADCGPTDINGGGTVVGDIFQSVGSTASTGLCSLLR